MPPYGINMTDFTEVNEPTNLLAALAPKTDPELNTPGLKAIILSRRTLNEARLKRDGTAITFELHTESHARPDWMPTIQYKISSTGQLTRESPNASSKPSLNGIWNRTPIREELLKLLSFSSKVIKYDLNNHTVSTRLPGGFHASRRLRSVFVEAP